MNKRIIQIGEISKLNIKSLIQNDFIDNIQYLDTGSITKNKISYLQTFKANTGVTPSRAKRRVKNNTIIYSTVRPNQEHYGFLEHPDANLIVSTGFTTIDIIDENIDPQFVYYLITQKHITDHLHNIGMSAVSSYPSIKPEDLSALEFTIPESLVDQKNIASILSEVDFKIGLNSKINTELEEMAKTLYEYWFVQFDFPDENGKPYKSSGGKMVWSKELRREIPENWAVFSLADLIKESKNGDWGKAETVGGFIKAYCIRGADINGLNGIEDFDPPIRYIDGAHSNRLLKPDDLIVEISGGSPTQSTGRMAHASKNVIARLQDRAVCSNFCKAISLKDVKLSYIVNHYWSHLYQSDVFFNFEGKTSGIKNLLFDQLVKDVMITLPKSNGSIEEFYCIAENIDMAKQNRLLQNQKLAELRDWLLPLLMNGQVTVKN